MLLKIVNRICRFLLRKTRMVQNEIIALNKSIPNIPQVERNPPSGNDKPSGLNAEAIPSEVIKCPTGINKEAINSPVTINK